MKNNQFLGKNLVFTGASVIKRDYLFGLAEAIGANPQKGMNKQTDLLIVGEKPGNKKNSWKTNPIFRDLTPDNCLSDIPTTFVPSIDIEPLLGVERVPIICRRVVFPLPDDPIMPSNSP